MNADRRKQIEAARKLIEEAQGLIEAARDQIEEIKSDEESYRDNMPESLQSSEKGDKAQAAVDALEEVYNELDGFSFDDIFSNLDTAAE